MYRKSAAEKVGTYNSKLFCAEDYDYWCRIALSAEIAYLNENLYEYRFQSKSLSVTKEQSVKEKIIRIQKKYSEEILKKYNPTKKQKAEIYYAMWKYNPAKELLYKALKSDFLGVLPRFLLFGLRKIGK